DVAALEITVGHGRTGGDGHAAADDGVCAEVADGEVGDVHRTAATATVAVVVAEQFADGAIDMFFKRGFDEVLVFGALEIGHAHAELFVGHLADGDGALGETFAVAAVRAGDVIAELQGGADAGRRAFLADGDVGGATVVEIADRLVRAGAELDDHLLHFADHEHVLVNRDRLLGRDGAGLEFGFEAALVAEQVDLATVDLCGLELGPHVAEIRGRLLLLRGFL